MYFVFCSLIFSPTFATPADGFETPADNVNIIGISEELCLLVKDGARRL
jgi:hypothetical protein